MTVGPCTHCPVPAEGERFYCERHRLRKTAHWRQLCRTSPKYFAAWEQGRGPGQAVAPGEEWTPSMPARGLGDVVAKVTTKLGIKPCGGCKKRQRALNRLMPFKRRKVIRPPSRTASGPFGWRGGTPTFLTLQSLMDDTRTLAAKLPVDTSLVVGIARSGLPVASLLAMLLHRPLAIVRQSSGDLVDGGSGWRLTGNTTGDGLVVVVDDTVLTGNSFKHVMPIVRAKYPQAIAAAVYCNPTARVKPDLWVRDLPWPHLLEWNLWNSILSPHCATDFDGILCHDPEPGDDDDGPRYERFLREARPLYLTRRVSIPMVVTARIEKYRPQTEEWLRRHGVRVDELVMAPWPSLAERNRHDIAAWKAEHYRRFLQRRHALKPPMFIESCPHQAARIAHLSGGVVLCPAAARCF